ncbi:hypothetical protein [Halolamina salifodinae]|uniref:Uncharacterized protein n=1 Tax=Halolamina salifodinae TaxID=1202767 RepID=A0A8T4GZF2_9EURY|nr:hypothetical protein [Halolamina salifodinae]MBP1988356.1 hypothetical protein [Halolamina salifodinae]
MADLQSCYFCASPDDVGEYAVVPPRLGGGDRSVALCPDCKTKLLRVMEPLIERAEQGTDASTDAGGSSAEQPSTPTDSATDGITMDSGGAGASANSGGAGASADSGGAGASADSGGNGSESPTNDGGAASDAGTTDDTVSPAAAGDDAPPQYRRAMRMLSNRPFPIELGEVESMLANAYDLEREEIDAVLDRAEAEGRLVAEDGQIREP